MRTETVNIYQFSELSEKAKENARDWFREGNLQDNYWSECVIEDATEIAKLFGLDIGTRPYDTVGGKKRYEPTVFWSGFSSQGDGASFTGTYRFKADAIEAVKAHAPQDETLHAIVADLMAAQSLCSGQLNFKITTSGRYCHEYSMDFEILDFDENGEEISNGGVTNVLEKEAAEALRAFARWIYRQLENEYEYRQSAEAVDEDITANEYEFHEDGKRAV